jgi:hypothetical protein
MAPFACRHQPCVSLSPLQPLTPQRLAGEVATYDASDLVYMTALLCEPGTAQLVHLLDTDSPIKRIQLVMDMLKQRTTELEVATSIQDKVRRRQPGGLSGRGYM